MCVFVYTVYGLMKLVVVVFFQLQDDQGGEKSQKYSILYICKK